MFLFPLTDLIPILVPGGIEVVNSEPEVNVPSFENFFKVKFLLSPIIHFLVFFLLEVNLIFLPTKLSITFIYILFNPWLI